MGGDDEEGGGGGGGVRRMVRAIKNILTHYVMELLSKTISFLASSNLFPGPIPLDCTQ